VTALLALLLAVAEPAAAAAPAPALPTPAVPDAQPLGVKVRAEKTTVKLGEPFGYEVEIRHAPEERYLLPGEPALEPFRATGARCARDVAGGVARTTCAMQLALFALGANEVPALVLEVDRPTGKARLSVPGPRITAEGVLDPSVPPASLALRDVAPPSPLLVRTWRPLWWALGILGALGVVAAAVAGVLHLRARRPAVPPLAPAERFERRLDALDAEELPRRGRGAEFVERLTEAVREYLSALTGLPALDLTSRELLDGLARSSGSPTIALDLPGLERFLAQADLVKFARQPAAPEVCAAGMEYARGLLARTRPPPEQAPEPGGIPQDKRQQARVS
jgi:hypothetical protein